MPPKSTATKAKATKVPEHGSYQGELHVFPPQRRVSIARIAFWSRCFGAADAGFQYSKETHADALFQT